MNVFGLDLSITASGFAPGLVTETVGGPARDGDGRLVVIRNRVRHWLRRNTYDLAVLEGIAFAGSEAVGLAMVHGVVRAELWQADIPHAQVYPTTLKCFATGNSLATKNEMVQAAEGIAGRKFADDNQAEAWLLRRMGLAALGDTGGLTPDQLDWLGRVDWPSKVTRFPGLPSPRSDIAKCRHKVYALRVGEHWLHPFTLDRCDKPPK